MNMRVQVSLLDPVFISCGYVPRMGLLDPILALFSTFCGTAITDCSGSFPRLHEAWDLQNRRSVSAGSWLTSETVMMCQEEVWGGDNLWETPSSECWLLRDSLAISNVWLIHTFHFRSFCG